MATRPRILAFAGSAREGSYNRLLLRAAAAAARAAGAEVTVLELRDLALPLFDQDAEARDGLPEGARRLKAEMRAHRGLLLACPEYNSSVTPLMKNAIDWASRAGPGEAPLAAYDGKVAGLLAASPGALGGLRALAAVRSILGNIRVLVLPDQFALAKAHEAFDPSGALKDGKQRESVDRVARALVSTVARVDA